jgi:DNA ligase-associated metallophosphoesterase
MLETQIAGQAVLLHPSGAMLLQDSRCLLVADAHFGKAVSFRTWGMPVPRGTTSATLERLSEVLRETGAQRLVFLGDFLHSRRAHAPATLAALAAWRVEHAALPITLVRGNHDSRAGDPPTGLNIDVVDEPLRIGPWALCHHPHSVEGAYVLAGHWHPCIRLHGPARQSLRLPCFWFGDPATRGIGVLPAFGSFTGMHPIQRSARDRVFAVAEHVVRELPSPPEREKPGA